MLVQWSDDTCLNVSIVVVLAILALLVLRNLVARESFTIEEDKQC